jgi:RNA polymerase-binding transcription factor DksA
MYIVQTLKQVESGARRQRMYEVQTMNTERRRKADTTYVHCTDNGHTIETARRRQRMYGVQTTYVHQTGKQH